MKVAIVGCGGLGNVHARCYSNIPGVELVGVCDIQAEAAAKLAGRFGTDAYTSFDEMLERSGCDAVSITLPSFLHKEYTIRAAAAGKHVITEKPIALSLEDAAEMIRFCEEKGVRLFVGHVVRFFPEYAQIKRKIDDGSIGRVGVIHMRRTGGHPGKSRPWFGEEDKSGGVVLDLMIHDIDFLRWAVGEVRSVYAMRSVSPDIDFALATFVFENGAVANVESFWGYPGPFFTATEFAGSAGIIRSDSRKTQTLQIRKHGEGGSPYSEQLKSPGYRTPFEIEISHFIDCIRENREPLVTAHDAYKALEIALAAAESARTGKTIYFEKSAQEGSR
jgi:predicted dehydrogenase